MTDTDSILEQHARMSECAIISGEPAKAHAAIERAFATLDEVANDRLSDSDEIRVITSQRVTTVLANAGIETIGDLRSLSFDELAGIQHSGPGTAKQLQNTLASHGMHLRPIAEGVAA